MTLTELQRPAATPRSTGHRPVILVLTEDSRPALGGIAEMLHRLAAALSGEYEVRIASSVPGASQVVDGRAAYEEVPWFRVDFPMAGDGLPIVRRLNTVAWYVGRRARVRRLLRRLIERHRPDWVMLFRLSRVTQPWVTALRDLGVTYDVVTYGLELVERDSTGARRARSRALREARRVFAISEATAALVRAQGVPAARITLVHPGIDPSVLAPPTAELRDRARRLASPVGRRYVLSICTLVRRKGIDLAIRAFASVASSFPDVDYVVAGGGDGRDALVALAESLGVGDRVRLIGPVDEETKLALYDGCEFFLLPNRRLEEDLEGFGIVFLEANAFGKAVIGGDNGGVPDAVARDESGLLVDTSVDEGPLREAMLRLLRDPSLARRLGESGRRRALSRFTWDHAATCFLRAHERDLTEATIA